MPTKSRISCRWYVEPLDTETNSVIGHQLSEENAGTIMCHDGRERQLWLCTPTFIDRLNRGATMVSPRFHVWCKDGNRLPRQLAFITKRKKRKVRLPVARH
jgi:hypothetical protein